MKKLILLFSHKLTQAQIDDAKTSLGVDEFVYMPKNLQDLWSNIPASMHSLNAYLTEIKAFVDGFSKEDIVLIQGDFGAVYEMVGYVKSRGLVAVYATTKRDAQEKIVNGKIEKLSRFEHVLFRKFSI